MSGKRVDSIQTFTDKSPGNQTTWNDQIELPKWVFDPFPCTVDNTDSCYPVPPSPGTVHGNPSSRLSVPPASGIIDVSACAQSPPASRATVPNDQQPAPVAPTTDLTLDESQGIVSKLRQKAGNGEGKENPSEYQQEQAIRIGGILPPKKTTVNVGAPIRPTYVGFISSVMDALVLFEGCLLGRLTAVPRKPREDELSGLIQSGNIFVYQDISSEICRRWLDRRSWQPVLQPYKCNKFFIYRELVEKEIKEGGLVKRSLAVKHNGIKHSLVSYCTEDMEKKLPRPSKDLLSTVRDGLILDGGGQRIVIEPISTPCYKKGKKRNRLTPAAKKEICQYYIDNPMCSQMGISTQFGVPIR